MRLIRLFWLFVRFVPRVRRVDWTAADAKGLEVFLASHTGRKLQANLMNDIVAANERAAMSQGDAFISGWACGFRGIIAVLENFSAKSGNSEDPNDEEGSDLEQFAPN